MFDVINPLVVNLGVPEFIDAFDVVGGSLVDLFLVKEAGARVVRKLSEKVLGLVSGAGCVVVGV